MIRRHRAYVLIDMITVLFVIAICGSLITGGILSIRRSQDHLAELANRTALMNDFVQCLRRDVRAATTASVHDGDGEGSPRVLELSNARRRVTYLWYGHRVERVGSGDRAVSAKVWDPMVVRVSVTGAGAEGTLVSATVYWHRVKGDIPQPDRRFDVELRCAGELYDDAN